jgi:hypothetical protein
MELACTGGAAAFPEQLAFILRRDQGGSVSFGWAAGPAFAARPTGVRA